jgi:hypothetical protein
MAGEGGREREGNILAGSDAESEGWEVVQASAEK